MTKRILWILTALAVGIVTGGVAYAVVVNPPSSSERYYACVSTAGVVKASTIKRNAEPTSCPAATDVVHSWNAVGPSGPTGDAGATGPTGATGPGPDVVRTTTIRVTDESYTIPQNAAGALLGPIDVSACRSFTINIAGAVAQVARIYSFDPVSGATVWRGQWSAYSTSPPNGSGDTGNTINQGAAYASSGAYYGNPADIGGNTPARVKIELYGFSDKPTSQADHIWLDCVPWT